MKKVLLVTFMLLFTSNAIHAQTFRDTHAHVELAQKIKGDDAKSAWELATSLEDEHLGDVDFDFLYGLAALKIKENERAVYAFERVVANKPQWVDAQYYLARTYYLTKNYQASFEITQLLTKLVVISPKLKESAATLNDLSNAALNKQTLLVHQSFNISLGYDSNINAGTSEDNIYLPFLDQEIILSENSKENSDSYLGFGYQLNGSKALTQSSKLTFFGSAKLHNFNEDSAFNRFTIRSNFQYHKDFENISASFGARVVPLWLDGEYYRTQYGATAGLNKTLDQQWAISSQIFFGKSKNDINQLLNTDDASIQVSTQYITQQWRHVLSLAYLQEESEFIQSQHNSKDTNMVSYMVNFAINQQWLATANVSYQHQAYQHEHPFFLEKQVDNMWLFSSSIQYKDSAKWTYQLSANMQDKDSNLALFSYQRAEVNISARMNF